MKIIRNLRVILHLLLSSDCAILDNELVLSYGCVKVVIKRDRLCITAPLIYLNPNVSTDETRGLGAELLQHSQRSILHR